MNRTAVDRRRSLGLARGAGLALILFALGCAGVPRRPWAGPAVPLTAWSPRLDDGTRVRIRPLPFGDDRVAATIDYVRRRCDPQAAASPSSVFYSPRMIVVHWTAIPTRHRSWQAFAPATLPGSRADIVQAGRLNVSAHFLVDRDGTIDQLLPETVIARHCIGLNRVAIGIENVGGPDAPLTAAQLRADAALVTHLAHKYPAIRYLVGHFESTRWERSPLWEERDPAYRTIKVDPGESFLAALRARVAGLGLLASDGTGAVGEKRVSSE